MRITKNLLNQQFSRLTVISMSLKKNNNQTWWKCKCDCGVEKEIRASSLLNGHTKSCGCLQKEYVASLGSLKKGKALTHGQSYTPEYRTWRHMKDRCYNPNFPHYRHYGGRDITVCDEWKNSFQSFINCVGKRPTKKHSLDRIDNNGNYEASNVKWSTAVEQIQNRRKNTHFALCPKCGQEFYHEVSRRL